MFGKNKIDTNHMEALALLKDVDADQGLVDSQDTEYGRINPDTDIIFEPVSAETPHRLVLEGETTFIADVDTGKTVYILDDYEDEQTVTLFDQGGNQVYFGSPDGFYEAISSSPITDLAAVFGSENAGYRAMELVLGSTDSINPTEALAANSPLSAGFAAYLGRDTESALADQEEVVASN